MDIMVDQLTDKYVKNVCAQVDNSVINLVLRVISMSASMVWFATAKKDTLVRNGIFFP